MKKVKLFILPFLLILIFGFILIDSYNTLLDLEKSINKTNLKESIKILKINLLIVSGLITLTILIIIFNFIKIIRKVVKETKEDTGFFKSEILKDKKIDLKNLQCIIAIDIDNLLKINNTYGEIVVKNILSELFSMLNSFFKGKSKLIRYSWNEILILVSNCKEDKPFTIAKKLKEKIESHKFNYKSLELNLKVYIGLNKELNKMKSLDEAIRNTFTALYQAKKSKKGIAEFGINNKISILPKLIELKKAIEKNKITLMFQPIVDTSNKSIFKYEILTRVIGTDGRQLNPSEFLDVIKGTTLSTDFNIKILEKAVELLKKYPDINLSINFSPVDIIGGSVARKIREINDKKILSRLTLEILETEDIYDYEKFRENLALIKLAGCKIAIDDFGSGYSNFMHLIELNVDYLKIDGSIVKNIKQDNKAYILVSAIKDFAEKANMEVICEFVSNEGIYDLLKQIGIKYMQGYFFSRPVNIPQNEIVAINGEKFYLKPKIEIQLPTDTENWEVGYWYGESK